MAQELANKVIADHRGAFNFFGIRADANKRVLKLFCNDHKEIEGVVLNSCEGITDFTPILHVLPNLKELHLKGTGIGQEQIDDLKRSFPKCWFPS